MELISEKFARSILKPRAQNANKGSFGRLLCICGSYGMAGAAVLCGGGALRCGTGLVDMAVPKSIYPIVASRLLEPIYTVYQKDDFSPVESALKRATACVMGCGFSTEYPDRVRDILKHCQVPLLLDADGLNCIAEEADRILPSVKTPLILTPHPGEMARLTGKTVSEVQKNRAEVAACCSKKWNAVVVLKGAGTIVASPNGQVLQNPTGNPGMAKGGSGDLLSGMIGAFLAQGAEPFAAASAGVYFHGLAGDFAAKKFSQTAMLPHDLLKELPAIFL